MSLTLHLLSLIEHHGPLTIAEFMAEALGNKKYGYYQTKDPFGVAGDFTTAPEISQIFGELVGIWCAYQWQQAGSPQNVAWVEIGPGRGTLMRDMIRATRNVPGFHSSLTIHMVESSEFLCQKQQDLLKDSPIPAHWHTHISELPEKPMLLVANEFFDALPIHQYVKTPNGWREKMVGNIAGKLEFVFSPSATPTTEKLALEHPIASEYAMAESCPIATNIMQTLAEHIKRHGLAGIIIDYGYTEPTFSNTLQAVKRHSYHPVLETIGEADITAHVDFKALATITSAMGLATSISSQGEFLKNMGIQLRLEALLKHATEKQTQDMISAAKRLISPEQMGTLFKVMTISLR